MLAGLAVAASNTRCKITSHIIVIVIELDQAVPCTRCELRSNLMFHTNISDNAAKLGSEREGLGWITSTFLEASIKQGTQSCGRPAIPAPWVEIRVGDCSVCSSSRYMFNRSDHLGPDGNMGLGNKRQAGPKLWRASLPDGAGRRRYDWPNCTL